MKGGSPLPRVTGFRGPRVEILKRPSRWEGSVQAAEAVTEVRDIGVSLGDLGASLGVGAYVQVNVDGQVHRVPASSLIAPLRPVQAFVPVELYSPDPLEVRTLPGGKIRTTYAPAPIPEPSPPVPDLLADVLGRQNETKQPAQDPSADRSFYPDLLNDAEAEGPFHQLERFVDEHSQSQAAAGHNVAHALVHEEPP